MNRPERASVGATALATLWIVFLALAATAPALFGSRSLGPEVLLDTDPLYAQGDPPPAPAIFDTTRYFYDLPRDFAAADGIRHGRVDLWNPRVAFGMPLWGEGGGLFFPAKLPFYVAPSRRTYDVATALRLVIAGLGAYLLARRRGLAPVPAAAAGSLFELSGAIIATLQFGVGAPPCLLPWALLGAQVIAQRQRLAAAAATGLALAATASSGHPMLVVVVFTGFGAAVAGHVLAAWRQPLTALAIGALATLAVLLGVAIAAPALLPVQEAWDAGRVYKQNPWIHNMFLNWYRNHTRHALPIALFAPATLGGLREDLSLGFPYSMVAPTLGLFGLMFAVAGLLRRGLDTALLAVGLVGVGLTVAPPVLVYVARIPLLHYVYPMYAWSLVALPLTQAAGRGVEALSPGRGRWTVLVAAAVVLAGAYSLTTLPDVPPSLLGFPVRQVFVASLNDWSGWLRLVLPLALVPLVAIALVLGAGTRLGDRCAIAAVAVASVELLVFVAPTTWFPDSTVLGSTPSPAVRFLQEGLGGGQYRMLAHPGTVGLPATPSLFGLADVRGSATLPAERYVRYLEAIVPHAGWYVWQSTNDVLRHPLLDLASVRYVARQVAAPNAPEPLLEGDAALPLVYRDERIAIYRNDAALPRARIVHATVAVRDSQEAFQRLSEAAATSAHAAAAGLTSRVFVEPSAAGDAPPQGPAALPLDSEDVRIVPGSDPNRVELEATLTLPGWVVLADTFYPGWTATIDGVAAPIHPTDLLFRGVFVPPGTHRVVWRYQPRPFRFGLALSALGLAISAFLIVRGRRV